MHIIRDFDFMTCCFDNSDFWGWQFFKSIILSQEIWHVNLLMHKSKEKLTNVSWPLGQETTKPKAQQEPQRVKRENWCVTVKISSMKDIKVMSNEQQVNHMENCWSHNVNKSPYPNIQTLSCVWEISFLCWLSLSQWKTLKFVFQIYYYHYAVVLWNVKV